MPYSKKDGLKPYPKKPMLVVKKSKKPKDTLKKK